MGTGTFLVTLLLEGGATKAGLGGCESNAGLSTGIFPGTLLVEGCATNAGLDDCESKLNGIGLKPEKAQMG